MCRTDCFAEVVPCIIHPGGDSLRSLPQDDYPLWKYPGGQEHFELQLEHEEVYKFCILLISYPILSTPISIHSIANRNPTTPAYT